MGHIEDNTLSDVNDYQKESSNNLGGYHKNIVYIDGNSIKSLQYYLEKNFEVYNEKKVYIWGINVYTRQVLKLLKDLNIKVNGIITNSKIGMKYDNTSVYVPKEIYTTEKMFIVCLARAVNDIRLQLLEMGFADFLILDFRNESISRYNDISNLPNLIVESKRILSGIIKNNNSLIILYPLLSIGEAYVASLFLARIGETRDIKILTTTEKSKLIFEKFDLYVEIIHRNEMTKLCIYCRLLFDNSQMVNIDIFFHNKQISRRLRPFFDCDMIELYRTYFGLDDSVKVKFPRIDVKRSINEKIDVLLSPYLNSREGLPNWFWEYIVKKLNNYGLSVYTNVGRGEDKVAGTHPLNISLEDLEVYLKNVGVFVGVRSGFCDVISHINIKKIILYQDRLYYNLCSLKTIDSSIDELIFKDNRDFADSVVKMILDRYKESDLYNKYNN